MIDDIIHELKYVIIFTNPVDLFNDIKQMQISSLISYNSRQSRLPDIIVFS